MPGRLGFNDRNQSVKILLDRVSPPSVTGSTEVSHFPSLEEGECENLRGVGPWLFLAPLTGDLGEGGQQQTHMKKAARPINGRQEELAVPGVYTGQDVRGNPPKEKPVWVNKLKVTRTPSVPGRSQILKALQELQRRVGCLGVNKFFFFLTINPSCFTLEFHPVCQLLPLDF